MPNPGRSTKGWINGPVTLPQAFGLKATFTFPKLQATLPSQVAQSQQSGGSGGSGGQSPPPKGGGSPHQNYLLGQKMVDAAGWGSQFPAFNNIVMAESGWQTTAQNPSGAYGIPQALPGSKMASAGADWRTNPATQIKWMIGYIRQRYGNPNNAWAFHLAHGWY